MKSALLDRNIDPISVVTPFSRDLGSREAARRLFAQDRGDRPDADDHLGGAPIVHRHEPHSAGGFARGLPALSAALVDRPGQSAGSDPARR
jgi:hypothetical protein